MRAASWALPFALCVPAGCTARHCDEAKPIPVRGSYVLENHLTPGQGMMVAGTMIADEQQVVVEYELSDGTRWKATYRIAARAVR
jgi:hypothetical protein